MTDQTEDTNTELTDERMDELVNGTTESNTREIPMTKDETPEASAAAKPAEELMEFFHNGKPIKGTREQIIKWAQMGYGVPQTMQKFNQDKTQWETQKTQWEKQWGHYRQVDDWAKNNPDQWQRIQASLQNPDQGQNPSATNSTPLPEIQSLKAELNQIKGVAQTWQEHMTQQQTKAEDEKLNQEIQSIQEKYKDLDWKNPDETGKSLEFKVLEHAQSNGIKNFATAFKDFYHDELISRAEAQAKQNVSKGIQAKTKLGILGESPTPRKGVAPVTDVKNKSYEDIMSEIRAERAQGLYG